MKTALYSLASAVVAAGIYWTYQAYEYKPINLIRVSQQWNIDLALPIVQQNQLRIEPTTVVGQQVVVRYQLLQSGAFELDATQRSAFDDSFHRMFCVFFIKDQRFSRQFVDDYHQVLAKFYNKNQIFIGSFVLDPKRCSSIYQQPTATTPATQGASS